MAFTDTWKEFLEKFAKIYQTKIEAQPDVLPQNAIDLLRKVSAKLAAPDVLDAIDKAITEETNADARNQASIDFLEEELKLFVTSVNEDLKQNRSQQRADSRLAQAKTIKDSLGALPLPGWVKKILGILNELIDLVKVARP